MEIKEVITKKDKKIFATFNANMYKNVSQAIPDLISDEYDNFNPQKNPAYDYCSVKQFLAFKEGECVGRIAGIISHAANEKWNTKRIRFSRVDFIDDIEVSSALFKAVENWGREEGLTEIHGPIGFSDMDQEGMLVDGFDEEGMFITIYNHPYYKEHLEKLGYTKDVDWVEYKIKVPEKPNEKLNQLSSAVLKRYHISLIEPRNKNEIKPYIAQVFSLLNVSYQNLYGTVLLSDKQIKKYYSQFILLVKPDYVKFLVDQDNQLIGFGLAIPSLNKPAKKGNGRLIPFVWYYILQSFIKKPEVLDLYLVGVLPDMQNKGLTAVLMNSMTNTALKNGVKYAETGPELETNQKVQALWKYYETIQHKRRRCWIKKLT